MKSMRKRAVMGIITAALAIAPFTGTGIDAVDKHLTKDTAINADAWWWSKEKTYKPGVYVFNRGFDALSFGNLVCYHAGDYVTIDSEGRDTTNWAYLTTALDKGYLYYVYG